jgi:hypothetical protein
LKNEDTENILKPIDDLSCIELRARLKSQGLIQTGLKNVLVERLKSPNKDDYRRVKKNEIENTEKTIDKLDVLKLRNVLRSEGLSTIKTKGVFVQRLKSPCKSIDDLTVIELRERLISEGLKTTGTKETSIQRLKAPTESDRKIDDVKDFTQKSPKSLSLKQDEGKQKEFDALTQEEIINMLETTGTEAVLQERLLEAIDGEEDLENDESLKKEINQRLIESKESKEVVINLIKSIGLCESLKSERPEEYIYFRALFQYHPNAVLKKVALINDIRIRRSEYVHALKPLSSVGDYQITIVLSDGEEDTISWVKPLRVALTESNRDKRSKLFIIQDSKTSSKLRQVLILNNVRRREQILRSYRDSQAIGQEFSGDNLDAFRQIFDKLYTTAAEDIKYEGSTILKARVGQDPTYGTRCFQVFGSRDNRWDNLGLKCLAGKAR